jgi:hypothetical protein
VPVLYRSLDSDKNMSPRLCPACLTKCHRSDGEEGPLEVIECVVPARKTDDDSVPTPAGDYHPLDSDDEAEG